MGLGFLRKLKDWGKKAVNFAKKKVLPTVNKVWGAAKPLVSMIPKYGTAISGAVDTGLGVVNKVAKSKNVSEAVQASTSPFIKLKKNNAPPSAPPAPMYDTGFEPDDDLAPLPPPLAPQVVLNM